VPLTATASAGRCARRGSTSRAWRTIPTIAAAANETLAEWVALGAQIDLLVSGPRLTDLREWVCSLPEGTQRIPCGGTHLRSLADVDGIGVELRYDEIGDQAGGGELTMTTAVRGG
jgi:alanyl-tRNA synthetase